MSRVPYMSVVDVLMYEMVSNRLYIAQAIGVLRRYMSKPWKDHWIIVKGVFMYLQDTARYGFCYQRRLGLDIVLDIHGYLDVEWVGDLDRRRSTSG
jgi:hypothetical protein